MQDWLTRQGVAFDLSYSKAELLELTSQNIPPKIFLSDLAAEEFDVQIIRLPIKHCVLNPIELCWSQLKSYVRQNNTSFRLTDINTLAQEYIAALDDCTKFIEHARKAELTFREADKYVETTIEAQIIDSETEDEEEFSLASDEELGL